MGKMIMKQLSLRMVIIMVKIILLQQRRIILAMVCGYCQGMGRNKMLFLTIILLK